MKKQYATPTIKTIKVRLESRVMGTSVEVSNNVNNEGFDAKEDISFGW